MNRLTCFNQGLVAQVMGLTVALIVVGCANDRPATSDTGTDEKFGRIEEQSHANFFDSDDPAAIKARFSGCDSCECLDAQATWDLDSDGVPDNVDNCPKEGNPQQGPCLAETGLGAPILSPGYAPVGDSTAITIFHGVAPSYHPQEIFVDEIDPQTGAILSQIVALRDNGVETDERAEDYRWTGSVKIDTSSPGLIMMRSRVVYNGRLYVSRAVEFRVSDLPPYPSSNPENTKWAVNPVSCSEVRPNEVVVGLRSGLSGDRIREIFAEAPILSYFGPLDLAAVHVDDEGDTTQMRAAAENFESHCEVTYAELSYRVYPPEVYSDPCVPSQTRPFDDATVLCDRDDDQISDCDDATPLGPI